jgi:hypothetical protein
MEDENYRTQIPTRDLQADYFLHFNPGFWMHKAKALLTFIETTSNINNIRFEGDNDTDETILSNMKMELHMMVFHSSETLFLNIFSIVKNPLYPWIWISRCDPNTLHSLISVLQQKGLAGLQGSPDIWLRNNFFPNVPQGHQNYDKSKKSTTFAVDYLQTLAKEYLDHNEYNSYKHGLRSFTGSGRWQAFNQRTGEKVVDMQGDIIEYLEFEKKDKDGNPYYENGKPCTLIKLTKKGFDYSRDLRIIHMNTAMLYNLFYARKEIIRTASSNSRTIGYYLFDDFTIKDIFNVSSQSDRDVFKKFTF